MVVAAIAVGSRSSGSRHSSRIRSNRDVCSGGINGNSSVGVARMVHALVDSGWAVRRQGRRRERNEQDQQLAARIEGL